MSKLTKWLRVQSNTVRKAAGEVEAAYLAWVESEAAEFASMYGYEPGTVPVRYSLERLAESSQGVLWRVCDCDYYWGSVYVLDTGAAAEVMVAKSQDAANLVVNPALDKIDVDELGADVDAALVKWMADEPEARDDSGYRIVKSDAAQRYTLGVAYPADEIDAHGDFTDTVELEKAAWAFMREVLRSGHPGGGTDHKDGTDGDVEVVESYIWRGPEWTVDAGDGDTVTIKTGDWMVGGVWTEDAWGRVEKGELTGWSIQGLARIDEDADAPDAEA